MARLWDADSGDCLQILEGHTDEIFSCAFNYEGDTIITGVCVCLRVPLIAHDKLHHRVLVPLLPKRCAWFPGDV